MSMSILTCALAPGDAATNQAPKIKEAREVMRFVMIYLQVMQRVSTLQVDWKLTTTLRPGHSPRTRLAERFSRGFDTQVVARSFGDLAEKPHDGTRRSLTAQCDLELVMIECREQGFGS